MGKDKIKESANKSPASAYRFRWGILVAVTILFSVILFPNLIVTKHQYRLGDIAERDIKSPRDFFIEDESATETNRQQAAAAVLTVYDYDAGLAAKLAAKVSATFTEMRAATAVSEENQRRQPVISDATVPAAAAANEPTAFGASDPRQYFEEKLGIRVSKGAFAALEKAKFSPQIAVLINRILVKTLVSQTKKEQVFYTSVGAAMLLLLLLVTTYILHLSHPGRLPPDHNKGLVFMASVFMTFFFMAEISSKLSAVLAITATIPVEMSSIWFGVPLASGAMIICLFMGLQVAIPLTVVMAVSYAVIFDNSLPVFLYFLINGTMAAYWVRNCRERKVFIAAGAKLGLLNILLATALNFYLADFTGSKLLWDWAFAFLGGIGAGIVTAGLAPLVEIAFGYTTDISLLELANLDRPILRKLMIEAPGTYHHSVIVGSLVEAATSEIGANHLLAKVCGYYHDIGKIKKPLYFIENQKPGKNKHDRLAPSMSSLILIAHVKDGVEIARENKLGQVIIDTIRQHHGTSLIKYFYEKAKQRKGEDAVNIDDFRYPGPKPQTREAGLVMLADVVEAASRTLDNPTPSRIQGLVQNLINNIFSDGQLDECELTLKDLHKIARSFNQILNGIHHHRVEYPEKRAATVENGKGKPKNGSPDRQPAKQSQHIPEEDKKNGSGHLKRLGLS